MAAFMKLGDVKGEASDSGHKEWILLESLSFPISRTIPSGAKDQQRTKGETTLGDVALSRQVDKSSPKLFEACANGTFFKDVEIHLCTTVKNAQEPYLKYKLHDVIVSSYSASGTSSGDPLPAESITLGYSSIEYIYIVVDPKTGEKKGEVPAKYNPSEGKA
jgi:type VI secretion system Hcp family effector